MRWPVLVVLVVVACSQDRTGGPAVDAAIDAVAAAACSTCSASQICLARYDGTCGVTMMGCVERTVACPANACSPACEAAYCPRPYQCSNRAPCGGEPPGAFTCYGP